MIPYLFSFHTIDIIKSDIILERAQDIESLFIAFRSDILGCEFSYLITVKLICSSICHIKHTLVYLLTPASDRIMIYECYFIRLESRLENSAGWGLYYVPAADLSGVGNP